QTRSNSARAALWHSKQLSPRKLLTSSAPRLTIFVPFLSVSRAKNSQSFVPGLNPFCCLIIASLGINWSTVPSGNWPFPALATSTVPARLPARLSTKKCFTGVILVMHWNLEPSTLYLGSPACTLPAHSKSAAKHETLPVSAKILIRLCFIDFLPAVT